METSRVVENTDSLAKKGTCIEFFSAYQDQDIDRMMSLCSPEGLVSFEPLAESGKGKIHELGKGLWTALMDSFPNIDNTVKNQSFDEANNAVTCLVNIFGTQKKEFAGIPSKGKDFESDHIFIFRFDDQSKIDRISISWDHERFVKQLTIG